MRFRLLMLSMSMLLITSTLVPAAETRHLLLLAQKRDHPPGTHEYYSGCLVLQKLLADVPNLKTTVVRADEPWPDGPKLLDQCDGVVLLLGQGGRFMLQDEARKEAFERLAARGGAIVGLHWGIGAKEDKYVPGHLALMGGMHGGSDRKYTFGEADIRVLEGPITEGIEDFRLNDEYYYQLKFAKTGKVTPLMQANIKGQWETCAWTFQREDGGRAFGFCGMHDHQNWRRDECRTLIVRGVLWSMKLPIPGDLALDLTEEDMKIVD